MTHKAFIFVHNTELIDYLEEKGKFKTFNDYQYVLLSDKEFDIGDRNVIVANKCKRNIEKWNNYLQWTGWYCLIANNLIDTDYVTLVEYDVDIDDDFQEVIKREIATDNLSCYSYAELPKDDAFLTGNVFSRGLVDYLVSNNISITNIVCDSRNPNWIVTSNITIKTELLTELITSDLFINLLNFLKNDKYAGHSLERFTTVFLTLVGYKYRCIHDMIRHYALDSHDTQGRHNEYLKYKELI